MLVCTVREQPRNIIHAHAGVQRPPVRTENPVAHWTVNPRYFALIANTHPRWGSAVHSHKLDTATDAGYFRGAKQSEGRSCSTKNAKLKAGDTVKLICKGNLDWLGLKDGDSMMICITAAHHFKDWKKFAASSNLNTLLPSHALQDGSLRFQRVTVSEAVKVYSQIYHFSIQRGEGAIRFDFRLL